MYVRDLSGNEFSCQATTTNEYELNGNRELSATILPSKVNRLFIDDIAEMWEITDFDDVAHKIVYAKKKGDGKRSEEHTSELQSRGHLVCRLLLEKKKKKTNQ